LIPGRGRPLFDRRRLDVELYVSVDLRTMTAIWMGLDTVRAAVASQRMLLTGSRQLASAMQTWLGP